MILICIKVWNLAINNYERRSGEYFIAGVFYYQILMLSLAANICMKTLCSDQVYDTMV